MFESIGRWLDFLNEKGIGRRIFDRQAERRWWRIVFHHEAGHAIAWAALYSRFEDMTAQNCLDDHLIPSYVKKASCGTPPTPADFEQSPLQAMMVLAAGAQAERLLFDIDSEGFNGDRTHMNRLLGGMPGQNRSHLAEGIESAHQEIEGEYPQTQTLLRRHEMALRAIGGAALKRFEQKSLLGQRFESQVILSAAEVQQIFEANPPTGD